MGFGIEIFKSGLDRKSPGIGIRIQTSQKKSRVQNPENPGDREWDFKSGDRDFLSLEV